MNGQVNISPESHAYAGNLLHNLDVWPKSPVTLGSWRPFQVTIRNLKPFLFSQYYLDHPLSVKGKNNSLMRRLPNS